MKTVRIAMLWLLAVSMVAGLYAQRPVPDLQDLVGARARDGERLLGERGYKWVHTEKSEESANSFWRDNRDGRCIWVTTTDGRYESIVYSPDLACQRGESETDSDTDQGSGRKDEFPTVCGVAIEGKIHPYRCKAVDIYRGSKKAKTDQVIRGSCVVLVMFPHRSPNALSQ